MNVLLVDGNNLLYRAHYTHLDLRTRKGEPTGVIYGALNMLQNAIRASRTREVCMFFDGDPANYTRTETFRSRVFPAYKQQRVKDAATQKAIWTQAAVLVRALRLLKYRYYHVEGVEADDVIGVVARQLRTNEAGRIVIYSGDSDYYQLIKNDVMLLKPTKDSSGGVLLDRPALAKVAGYDPVKAAHYKAIKGDTADNFKGVYKMGHKAALHALNNGVDALTPWPELPSSVQRVAKTEANWREAHACYNLARIRTRIKDPAFTPSEKAALRHVVADVLGYERTFAGSTEKRWAKFTKFCKRWELVSFMMQRAELLS